MINLKSPEEIEVMRQGGQTAARILQDILASAQVGVATLALNDLAEERIKAAGMQPSFKNYRGYPFAICTNVNDGVVHGLPSPCRLQKGDLLSVDLGVYYQGFHSDTSAMVVVGEKNLSKEEGDKRRRFIRAGRKALQAASGQLRSGGRLGDISSVIQANIERSGFNVVRDLVGHGIGRRLHEDPTVPCFGERGRGLVLKEGLVLAVEVIYTQGAPQLRMESDGWTIVTADGSWGGVWEQTLALTSSGPIALTLV